MWILWSSSGWSSKFSQLSQLAEWVHQHCDPDFYSNLTIHFDPNAKED